MSLLIPSQNQTPLSPFINYLLLIIITKSIIEGLLISVYTNSPDFTLLSTNRIIEHISNNLETCSIIGFFGPLHLQGLPMTIGIIDIIYIRSDGVYLLITFFPLTNYYLFFFSFFF